MSLKNVSKMFLNPNEYDIQWIKNNIVRSDGSQVNVIDNFL